MHEDIGLLAGARLVEGLGLAVATVALFSRHPALSITLPAALAAAGTLAAASSVLLWAGIGTAATLERNSRIAASRVSAHVADVNAAGSYFAMIALLGVGMALRAEGRARVLWGAAAAANLAGLWMSASRSAMAATAVTAAGAAIWVCTTRWKPAARAIATTILLVAALAVGTWWAWQLTRVGYRGVDLRQQFNATSGRMIQASPVFGVGVGQYYPLSSLFFTPELAWTYGQENAHNYFLQVGAELGLLGLGLFAAWLAAGAVRAGRALAREPRDWRLLGAASGALVFAATSVTGHPFLVDEVTYPFWMQFGLVIALASSALLSTGTSQLVGSRAPAWATAALAAGIAVPALVVATRPLEPPALQAVDGFYEWETGSDGTPFRWTERYASLFIPSGVRRVAVQVRMPTRPPALMPMEVEVRIGGRNSGRTVVGDSWATLNLTVPPLDPRPGLTRIDLKVERTWRPAFYIPGSADMREVGVQVAAPQPLQ
jgi:O-antigen ligase